MISRDFILLKSLTNFNSNLKGLSRYISSFKNT